MSGVLRALIFDVDGTLAETERDGHRVAFNRAFADARLAWDWDVDTYGELLAVTGGKERIAHWAGRIGHAIDDGAVRRLHAQKTAHYLALVRDGAVALRPGVAALLREAREQGLKLAIATTTTEANVSELLDTALGPGALETFDVVGAGDVVPRKKPAPDIYEWVLERLALPAEACVAFEDSAPGVAAARAAGLATVLVRSVYTGRAAIDGVVADLDGFGDEAAPAHGTIAGRRWSGRVVPGELAGWLAAAAPAG